MPSAFINLSNISTETFLLPASKSVTYVLSTSAFKANPSCESSNSLRSCLILCPTFFLISIPARSDIVAFKSTDFKGHFLVLQNPFYEKNHFNKRIEKGVRV